MKENIIKIIIILRRIILRLIILRNLIFDTMFKILKSIFKNEVSLAATNFWKRSEDFL